MTEYALSVWQPWAWLLAAGIKDVENRTWWTPFRGWFYIHAARTLDEAAMDDFIGDSGPLFESELIYGLTPAEFMGKMRLGGLIGKARLVDCVKNHHSTWFHGPYGFVIADAVEIDFIPLRGMQGFFPVNI